jgi:serine/threonine protein kinase
MNPVEYAIKTDNLTFFKTICTQTDYEPQDSMMELCGRWGAVGCAHYLVENRKVDVLTVFKCLQFGMNGTKSFDFLLDYLEDVELQDDKRKTLLHYASAKNNIEIATKLMKRGANVLATDWNGNTPIDFANTTEMKHILINFHSIILQGISGKVSFDWKSLRDYQKFVHQWRHAESGSNFLHYAFKASNVDAIHSIECECPELLHEKNHDGLLPIEVALHSNVVLSSLFTKALKDPDVPLLEQLLAHSKLGVLLLKNSNSQYVYQDLHDSVESMFVAYLKSDLETVIFEITQFLEGLAVYWEQNPVGILPLVSKIVESLTPIAQTEQMQLSLEILSQVEGKSEELRSKVTEDQVAPQEITLLSEERNSLLPQLLETIEERIESATTVLEGYDQNLRDLKSLQSSLHDVLEKYSLSELSQELIQFEGGLWDRAAEQQVSALYKSILDHKTFLLKKESILSPQLNIEIVSLLQMIPKADNAQAQLRKSLSILIYDTLNKVNDLSLSYQKRKRELQLEKVKLYAVKDTYSQMLTSTQGIAELRKSYEDQNGKILELEANLAALKVRTRGQHLHPSVHEDVQKLEVEWISMKKEKTFVGIRKDLIARSIILPELLYWYPEFNPLNAIDISKRYPTKYFESDFAVVRELSSRVILAHTTQGKEVILKKFSVKEDRSLLRHAVEILGRLSFHQNILNLHSIVHGSTNDVMYLEHRFLEMGDLAQWRRSDGFDATRLSKIYFDVIKGLQALHEHGILHRDLKPQNILIHEEGAVLSDFDVSEFQAIQSNLTAHGTLRFFGTTDFVDPQVIFSGKYTVYTDLFSLGVTFGHVLTGCPSQVIKTLKEYEKDDRLTKDQKELVCGLLHPTPEERTPLAQLLKNPFIRGDRECVICTDTKMQKEGILCQPDKVHFVCQPCFEKYVEQEVNKNVDELMKFKGEIRCPCNFDCPNQFSFDFLSKETPPQVVSLYLRGKRKVFEEEARILERKRLKTMIENEREETKRIHDDLQQALLSDRQESRERLLEYLLTEKAHENDVNTRMCPTCERIIQKIAGCDSVRCGQDYHGGNQQFGCRTSFSFSQAPRYKSKVVQLDQMLVELTGPQYRRQDIQ